MFSKKFAYKRHFAPYHNLKFGGFKKKPYLCTRKHFSQFVRHYNHKKTKKQRIADRMSYFSTKQSFGHTIRSQGLRKPKS